MSILVNLKNLNLSFGEKVIFNQAELTIHKGDRIGLIGLNGQGKSTLFQILLGKLKPDISKPSFIYDKSNENFGIFLIPQELEIEKYKHLSVENYYLAFYPKLHDIFLELEKDYSNEKLLNEFEKLGGWEIQTSYLSYLKSYKFGDLNRNIENLSGGEKRKMALSIGLSSKAEFLLWDEPTNHLDIGTIEKFEDEIINSKKTLMIISHDRYLLNYTTNNICHIEDGKITQFKGQYLDYLEYLKEKEAELMKNLDKLENRHRRELAWMRQGIKARGTRSKKRVEGFHNIKDEIRKIKDKSKKVVDLSLLHSGRKSKILVEIKHGQFSYGDHCIFEDINLVVAKKDKIALIGPNGAGKSTLIKIFSEKLKLSAGTQKNAQELKVVVFDQNRESLDETKTPLEIVGDGQDFVHLGDGSRLHIHAYLAKFLFNKDQVNRPVSSLSGGEKNRLQLAMFMSQAADLWIFDEPTNDLDIETIELLENELKNYEAAVVIIGHDRAFLDNICSSTWLIHQNNVEVFEGGYTQVAPYLEALSLEENLKTTVGQETALPKKTKKTYKPTNQEKKRFKLIEKEIAESEESVQKLSEQLASFDFSDMNQDKQNEYAELEKNKKLAEEKLETLFLEWEDLTKKIEG